MGKIRETLEDGVHFITDINNLNGFIFTELGLLSTNATILAGDASYASFSGRFEAIPYNPVGGVIFGILGIALGIAAATSYTQAFKSFTGK